MATNSYQHSYSDDPEEAQRQREQGRGATPRPVNPRGPAPITPYGPIVRDGEDLFDQWRNPSPRITVPPASTPGSSDSGTAAPAPNPWTEQSNALLQQLLTNQQAVQTQATDQGHALYDTLSQRASQALDIDRNDPVIRTQADAYAANQERARRDYLADVAEEAGPLANLRGEERMAAERKGQQTGAFEAELIGRELERRRSDIAQALQMQAGLLSADQQRALQMELAALDAAIQQQQFSQQESQFAQRLGLDAETQAAYFDAVRRGLFRAE